MTTCVFGLEAELAVSALRQGKSVSVHDTVYGLAEIAVRTLPHLPGGGSRMFLGNGSLLYVDCGDHPEVATPECSTPGEALCHLRAGERLVGQLAARLRAESGLDQVSVSRCNVDYVTGATWGCHESYLGIRPVLAYREWLIPHLVSRTVYTGSGGLDPRTPGIRFSLSPRTAHFERAVSSESTSTRGIFHTRDEPLSNAGYSRVHVLAGDNACSHRATWLKIGTTALIVAAADLPRRPFGRLTLAAPLKALMGFARGAGYCAEVTMADGQVRLMSALEMQRHYLEGIEAVANSPGMPEWAGTVCNVWRETLDLLSAGPDRCVRHFDWAIKRELFLRELERHGLGWDTATVWSVVLEKIGREFREALNHPHFIQNENIERIRSSGADGAQAIHKLGRLLAPHGLAWPRLDEFTALRRRLCEIDVRFGEVNDGIFATLDGQGLLPEHRIVAESDIAAAADHAPPATRASVRARCVKELDARRNNYRCGWEGIAGPGTLLDLSDPFATEATWRETVEQL